MFASGRFAVVGAEVSGSASPAMQNAALRAFGYEPTYEYRSLNDSAFRTLARSLHAQRFRGLNITSPHKGAAYELADWRSEVVATTAASNTWRIGKRGIEAFNTDVDGLAAMILAYGELSRGNAVVLLGAGGAARAAAHVLGRWADSVLVINRTASHARSLCAAQALDPGNTARWQSLALQHPGDLPALRAAFADASLVIDTVGVRAASRCSGPEAQLPWRDLDPRAELFDLSYGAGPSPLSLWSGRGCFDGATMLLHQGAASFELWTGQRAPLEVMRAALASHLHRPADSVPIVPEAIGSFEAGIRRE